MRTPRRSFYQILKDCDKIKEAAKVAKSMDELSKLTHLSKSQIMTTLSNYPIVKRRIQKQIVQNAVNEIQSDFILDDFSEDDTFINLPDSIEIPDIPGFSDTLEACFGETQESVENLQYPENILSLRPEFQEFVPGKKYVLDTSVSCVYEINELLALATASGSSVVITSIVNDELEKLHNRNEVDSIRARIILSKAAVEKYETVYIEKIGVPDDCIVKYCVEHKDDVILLTADKHMTLDARAKGVQTIYFSHWNQNHVREKITLEIAQFKSGVLSIDASEFKKRNQLIWVLNKNKRYEKGPIQLFEDFQIFLAQKDFEKIVFMYLNVLKVSPEDNCEIVFTRAISKNTKLLNDKYNEFIEKACQELII